ncbi:MAG: SUMF1/EgtB/PvdO family nonheme iron enzyme [Bacteroidetes bacterium]|nr:SUMF1/EgtB/PvdO family nonheme iron enzyme [Bacteroidota bacterium]
MTRGALGGASAANVTFTISWQNSWNVSGLPGNHDAAWVFIKFRECGTGDNWHHALLSTTMGDHSLSAGLAFARSITTQDRLGNAGAHNTGALVRRASLGVGHIVNQTVTLRVVGGNGVSGAVTFDNNTEYDIRVIGIEMVQVRQGNYYLGDPNTTNSMNGFFDGAAPGASMIVVTAENSILNVKDPVNQVCCWSYPDKALPAVYPKGWAEFYVMKYEISQGQYADFLNCLSTNAATQRRLGNFNNSRMTIGNTPDASTARYLATEPNRACNWLSWADLVAYLDWAALRPMTELEYEKACKGTTGAPYVDGAYAWGTTLFSELYEVRLTENGTDTVITAPINLNVPPNAHINWNYECCAANPYNYYCQCVQGGHYGRNAANTLSNLGGGPVGCGIFARDHTLTRVQTGATYWGIMEMTGNVNEMVVSVYGNASDNVANTTISAYTGLWGNGVVNNSTGLADVANWPLDLRNGRCGFGVRGGSWYSDLNRGRVGDRQEISNSNGNSNSRQNYNGGRGVR